MSADAMGTRKDGAEQQRLEQSRLRTKDWQRWGPYLSERQWGTVREDYSHDGSAWSYLPHDRARSKVYRWGEDGLLGFTDRQCRLCFSLGLWNGKDPILKERLFGLTGEEGNHGEDVKEIYYYLDSTPTHSLVKMRYLYPMEEYPYADLAKVNGSRSQQEREYELEDTGVFENDRYWDVTIEYAKADANDILIKVTVTNMSDAEEQLHVIPQMLFRNTWSFNAKENLRKLAKPSIRLDDSAACAENFVVMVAEHETLGTMVLQADQRLASGERCPGVPLFTENEDNGKFLKEAFHRRIIEGDGDATNPDNVGTKAGVWYTTTVPAKKASVLQFRLYNPAEAADTAAEAKSPTVDATASARKAASKWRSRRGSVGGAAGEGQLARTVSGEPRGDDDCKFDNPVTTPKAIDTCDFDNDMVEVGGQVVLVRKASGAKPPAITGFGSWFEAMFVNRQREADNFYNAIFAPTATEVQRRVARLAYAGMLCSKQFYYYSVAEWLQGDPQMPPPPESRRKVRNTDWGHLFNRDVISMPDKWEYPWYASWDLAFHMIPFAVVDPVFAKSQLELFLREWYMHPNGQIPAYEWAFSDVNPPVHAWSCYRVYEISRTTTGIADVEFLARVFHKLLINFTWWVNRKDPEGEHLFSGGFLGLDNIGLFDRSKPLPIDGRLHQADGTAWMAQFASSMMNIALELAKGDPVYEDVACKFFEHYVQISEAINGNESEVGLWDDVDGFYYDSWHANDGTVVPMKVRSMVGLIPLFAVRVLAEKDLEHLPEFVARTDWFLENRPDLAKRMTVMVDHTAAEKGEVKKTKCRLMALPSHSRLIRILQRMFDEEEFLSPYGIRSLSKVHQKPYVLVLGDQEYSIAYQPEESDTAMFGGNSNWRGPVWFPVNFLIIESLRKYYKFYGDDLKVEVPTHSGKWMNLSEAADEIARRLQGLFVADPESGAVPCHDAKSQFKTSDPLFYEYFDPETGRGLGASHQTGWTGLVSEFTPQCHQKVGGTYQRHSVKRVPPTTSQEAIPEEAAGEMEGLTERMTALESKMDEILSLLRSSQNATSSTAKP